MLPQSLAHRILVKMELAGDVPGRPGAGRRRPQQPVKDYVDAVWPAVDPARLLCVCCPTATFLAQTRRRVLDA